VEEGERERESVCVCVCVCVVEVEVVVVLMMGNVLAGCRDQRADAEHKQKSEGGGAGRLMNLTLKAGKLTLASRT
jgi:hypothetical protein